MQHGLCGGVWRVDWQERRNQEDASSAQARGEKAYDGGVVTFVCVSWRTCVPWPWGTLWRVPAHTDGFICGQGFVAAWARGNRPTSSLLSV
eukprot:jgi/Mesvir1/10484/Mv26182-RA.1